jgi:hypothetical protein
LSVARAEDGLCTRDNQGNPLGSLRKLPISPERLAELEQRLEYDGPWKTTAEVMSRLRESDAS